MLRTGTIAGPAAPAPPRSRGGSKQDPLDDRTDSMHLPAAAMLVVAASHASLTAHPASESPLTGD